jgi:hypothetical protein
LKEETSSYQKKIVRSAGRTIFFFEQENHRLCQRQCSVLLQAASSASGSCGRALPLKKVAVHLRAVGQVMQVKDISVRLETPAISSSRDWSSHLLRLSRKTIVSAGGAKSCCDANAEALFCMDIKRGQGKTKKEQNCREGAGENKARIIERER